MELVESRDWFIICYCDHCSVKLVEQELWQREEKGLIGILPVRDAAEMTSMDSVLSQGFFCGLVLLPRRMRKVFFW